MLSKSNLKDYQKKLIKSQCSKRANTDWLLMGGGKTICTLTSIEHLLSKKYLTGVLVIAPKLVIELVWKQEALKWEHTKNLSFCTITGTKDQRLSALISSKANIFLISYDNLEWLADVLHVYYIAKNRPIPFDGMVLDEVSKCKNSQSVRVKSIGKFQKYIKWAVGLTGTPASNNYLDLFGQFLVVDGGATFGKSITKFKANWFDHNTWTHRYTIKKHKEQEFKDLVASKVFQLDDDDYQKMPDLIMNDIYLDFDKKLRNLYKEMEDEFFVAFESGNQLDIQSQVVLTTKCLQFANGAVKLAPDSKEYENIHDFKLDKLEDILEECGTVLCAYIYKADAEKIVKRFKSYGAIDFTSCGPKKREEALEKFKSGECRLLLGHGNSMGHGVDGLQNATNNIVWFGLPWSLEIYLQFNARVHRQGQTKPVVCHRIMMLETLDEAVKERLQIKTEDQDALTKAVNAYKSRLRRQVG